MEKYELTKGILNERRGSKIIQYGTTDNDLNYLVSSESNGKFLVSTGYQKTINQLLLNGERVPKENVQDIIECDSDVLDMYETFPQNEIKE